VSVVDSAGPYLDFTPPSINASGTVAFRARLDGGGHAILSGDPAGTDVIADTSGPYDAFGTAVVIGDLGSVFFFVATGQALSGWYTGPDPDTDAVDPFETDRLAVDAAGNLVVRATIDGTSGIYRGEDALVDEDDGDFDGFGPPALNDAGTVAFQARLEGALGAGIYTVPFLGGPVTTLADSDGPFLGFEEQVAINDAGVVAFQAGLDEPPLALVEGIFTGPDPATDTVVDTSGPFELLEEFAITENGAVIFWGALADRGGIYAGPDPDADRVIGSFDPLFGSTVANVNMRAEGYDAGRLAFSYTLTDGRNGVAIAFAPEPGGAALAASTCVLLRGARRRRS
jgi:hypothetical protein